MSAAVSRSIFAPGIIPKAMENIRASNLPEGVKNILCHPAGPLTIHFWAPTMKWGITIANIMDINRPVSSMSTPQQGAVACTGVIWSRYAMVVIPKNWNLFSVNVFMAGTGLYQLFRIFMYQNYGKEITMDFGKKK
eukprot:GDKK01046523.1.p1 GENE.GDKK01046523.1~~GDKK01046523.1.p1  ORF type:complete len:136 (-),score=16.57 GDKK01046523.1:72-479(-)